MAKREYYEGYSYKDTPQARYNKKYTIFVRLRMESGKDDDLLELLENKPKQTEVKRLVRLGMESEAKKAESTKKEKHKKVEK